MSFPSYSINGLQFAKWPSPLLLWSAGGADLATVTEKSERSADVVRRTSAPLVFLSSNVPYPLVWLIWHEVSGNLAGRHSTLRQKQVRTLSVCPAWKWLLQITISLFLTWCKSKYLNSASNHPRSEASGLGDLESRNLEDTHSCCYHSLQINETGSSLFWQQEYKKAQHFERAVWVFVSKVLRVFICFNSTVQFLWIYSTDIRGQNHVCKTMFITPLW